MNADMRSHHEHRLTNGERFVTWPKLWMILATMSGIAITVLGVVGGLHASMPHDNAVTKAVFEAYNESIKERHQEILRRLDGIEAKLEKR